MFKKTLKVLLTILLVLLILLVTGWATYPLYEDKVQKYIKIPWETALDIPKNLDSFVPAQIKGNLKYSEDEVLPIANIAKVIYGNTVVEIPLYTTSVRDTFSDTVFANDGSFYIVVTKKEDSKLKNEKSDLYIHNLGRNQPRVLEVRSKESDVVLYIQCYTPEALSFYESDNIELIRFSSTKVDLSKSNDEVAAMTTIDENLYPEKDKMFLDDIYLELVNNNKRNFEGYSDFIEYKDKVFNYYRTVGLMDTRIKVEFAKLIELGYTPLEAGAYKGVAYVKFKELTLLGFPVTKNSNLIYRVSNLNQ